MRRTRIVLAESLFAMALVIPLVECGGSGTSAPSSSLPPADGGAPAEMQDAAAPEDAGYDSPARAADDAGASTDARPDQVGTSSLKLRCATAAVVGLAWSFAADVPASTYSVSRNGSVIGKTATTSFTDQDVSPTTHYAYTVTALDASNKASSALTTVVTTPAASADGDAPYCQSALVSSMTWSWSTGFNQQDGSDLWPSTWGADGNVYFFFGDGGGFFGSDSLGRASFGIAMAGKTPVVDSSSVQNVFGGYQATHPSTIDGKAGSLIAIGSDFYSIAGIWRSGEGGPSGSPNHNEVIRSQGNAYSWVPSPETFCSADPNGNPISGSWCPASFVNFGAGNAGARDSYVYVFVFANEACAWTTGCTTPPAESFMARVPNDQLLAQSAYECIVGFDPSQNPIWSTDCTEMAPIFTDHGARPMAIGEAVYNSALKRYVATAQGATVSQAAFYEAPEPWGPWSVMGYFDTKADQSGGFGDLGSSSYAPGHGDTLGVNFVNAWTSPDGRTMWATFSSDGVAPASALLQPLAGNDMDSFSLISVTLNP